jgi:hypothetical protein
MTKDQIIAELKRVAVAMNGVTPGIGTFEVQTGIRRSDWIGIHWRNWGEAVTEAGLTPNTLTARHDENAILRKYALLARELGRYPTKYDLKMKRRQDSTFPSDTVFVNRFGSYPAVRARAFEFCLEQDDLTDIAPLLESGLTRSGASTGETRATPPEYGYVYLVRHGSRAEYKIGKTSNPLRREGEIRLQLPEKLKPIHYIETDDPAGIEAYWHSRFAAKRKEGEWFALNVEDVAAFKRWRRIV